MKVLFDLGHPADVHLFKNSIRHCYRQGYQVQIVIRPRDNMRELLDRYGFPYRSIGHFDTPLSKIWGIFRIGLVLNRITRQFRPDLMVSFGSPYSAHLSWFYHIPSITLVDTEPKFMTPFYFYYRVVFQPFVKKVFLPESFTSHFSAPRIVRYRGYKELAYLHPNHFRVQPEVLKPLNLRRDERNIVVKFAATDAIHDVNYRMFPSNEARVRFVRELQRFGRVFVSSEVEIPELSHLFVRLAPGDIHHLLAVADLYVGEGATMAAEAGVLGTPWVFLYNHSLGYLQEQQNRYGLGRICTTPAAALAAAEKILSLANARQLWQQKRRRLLDDHIDVTEMIVGEIEKNAEAIRRKTGE